MIKNERLCCVIPIINMTLLVNAKPLEKENCVRSTSSRPAYTLC